MKSLVKLFFWLGGLSFLASPVLLAQREKLPPEDLEFVEKTWPNAKKTSTGIRYIIQKEGSGPLAKPGDKVALFYVGRLLNGTIFDQGLDKEHAFKFRVGRGEVIQGWDQILQLMKLGEKRLVIIPAELAYGSRGSPPRIPRSATLVFEMELIELSHD